MKDINSLFEDFQEVIVKVTDTFAPVKTVHEVRKDKPKWFSNTLKNLRTKRNGLHKEWSQDKPNNRKRAKFCECRTKFEKQYATAKKGFLC